MKCAHPITVINPHFRGLDPTALSELCKREKLVENGYCSSYVDVGGIRQYYPVNYSYQVPCGKCPACRKNIASAWVGRLLGEFFAQERQGKKSAFITLTFKPECEPQTDKEAYEYLRRFIDLFRKRYNIRPTYFFTLERGPKTGRLHFHGILFGCSIYHLSYRAIADVWRYGYTWIEPVKAAHFPYLVKYIRKPCTPDPSASPEVRALLRNFKPRCFTANGLGLSAVNAEMISFCINEGGTPRSYVVYGNKKYPLHPYLRYRIFSDDFRLSLRAAAFGKTPDLTLNGRTYSDIPSYLQAVDEYVKKQDRFSELLGLPADSRGVRHAPARIDMDLSFMEDILAPPQCIAYGYRSRFEYKPEDSLTIAESLMKGSLFAPELVEFMRDIKNSDPDLYNELTPVIPAGVHFVTMPE